MPECVTMLGNHCCDQFTSEMNGFFRVMEEINLFRCRKKKTNSRFDGESVFFHRTSIIATYKNENKRRLRRTSMNSF